MIREIGALKDFSGTLVPNRNFIRYPSILDKDPVLAANFLTRKDAEDSLALMEEAFLLLEDNPEEYAILSNSILHSVKNFDWFCAFTVELGRIIRGESFLEFPAHLVKEKKRNKLEFQPPIKIKNKKVAYETFRVKLADAINLHRICYIRKDLEPEEFENGLPAWYVLKNTTIFESYNEKTNVRVRVDARGGELFYYVSGASDNWQQIDEVPLEMDYVVSALIFRN